ncbi:hypothetical protein ACR0ST_05415 [Aliidiomarina sp. Khilg15.8]
MLTTHLRCTSFLLIWFTTMVGCSPHPDIPSESPFCALGSDVKENCRYEVGENEFWLLSSDLQMPVERPLQLSLRSAERIEIKHSEIRGLSMYMGRIPVVWNRVSPIEWEARLQLGACTDPNMVWQLQMTLKNQNGSSYEQLLPFSSTQP